MPIFERSLILQTQRLENLAEVLAHSHDPDELHASVQLEAIAFAPSPQLYAALDFARKGLQPS